MDHQRMPSKNNQIFDESLLRRWCVGVVAVTKPGGTDVIEVYPVEHLTLEDGDPNEIKKIDATIPDVKGVSKSSNVERSAVQRARWFQDGDDGRQTAPDVVVGETVVLYRYGDSGEFFWKTIFRENELRRLEHVVHAYSNLRSGRTPFDMESSYGTIFSTRDKVVRTYTTMSDGEAYRYDMSFDTNTSFANMSDNVDNAFRIISPDTDVYMRDTVGAYVRCLGPDVHIRGMNIVLHGRVFVDYDLNVNNVVYAAAYVTPGRVGPDDGGLREDK